MLAAAVAPEFIRRKNRLAYESYVGTRWYFVTACTYGKRPWLSDGQLVEAMLGALREQCVQHSFNVYAYCFMPDHLHLELAGLAQSSDLVALIRGFKGVSVAIARGHDITRLWQRSFYDHILRQGEGTNAVARYIFNNPVRKGLAKDMRHWPYSGSWMFDWRTWAEPSEEFQPPWKPSMAG